MRNKMRVGKKAGLRNKNKAVRMVVGQFGGGEMAGREHTFLSSNTKCSSGASSKYIFNSL